MAKDFKPEDPMQNRDSGRVEEGADDGDKGRAFEHPRAQEVRDGEISAAQIGDYANSDPEFPDAIYPPGHVETAAAAAAFAVPADAPPDEDAPPRGGSLL